LSLCILVDGFFGFAYSGLGGNFHAFGGNGKLHGVRALVGELRDAATASLSSALSRTTVLLFSRGRMLRIRNWPVRMREIRRRWPTERKDGFVLREFQMGVRTAARKFFDFIHGFLGDQDADFAVRPATCCSKLIRAWWPDAIAGACGTDQKLAGLNGEVPRPDPKKAWMKSKNFRCGRF